MTMSTYRCILIALLFVSGLLVFCVPATAQDSAKGGKIFKARCAQCHTIEEGGINKVGPALYGVVACKSGTLSGYSYTSAMQSKGAMWTTQNLDTFLLDPKKFVPGTKQVSAGQKNPRDRADLIAYIVQFRNASAPLNACGR